MPPKVRIEYEKTITRPELVDESTKVWLLAKSLRTLPLQETLEELRKQHPQFCQSYPIIVRYMTQFNAYSKKAVDKYLIYIETHPWKDEDAFIEAQSKYIYYLMRALSPKMPLAEVYKRQADVVDILRKEAAEFKTNVNAAKERADEIESKYKVSRREELIQMFQNFPEQFRTTEDKIIVPKMPDAVPTTDAVELDCVDVIKADDLLL